MWRHTSEHITIKEGRALVLALRRLARSSKHRSRNHAFLLDNLALCFAVHKGRAHAYDMLRIMQQVGSICLAASLGVFPRWIPSEWNVADGPSRGQVSPGPFKKEPAESATPPNVVKGGGDEGAGVGVSETGGPDLEGFVPARACERESSQASDGPLRVGDANSQKSKEISASCVSASQRRGGNFGKKAGAHQAGGEKRFGGAQSSIWTAADPALADFMDLLVEDGKAAHVQKDPGSSEILFPAVQEQPSQGKKGPERLEKACPATSRLPLTRLPCMA